jgi:Fe2+ transport system protein FeoA
VKPSGLPALPTEYLTSVFALVQNNPAMGQEAPVARCMVVWSGMRQKLLSIGFTKWKDHKGRSGTECQPYARRRVLFKAMERMRWHPVEEHKCWVKPSGFPAMETHYLTSVLGRQQNNPAMGQEALVARCMVVWSGLRQKLLLIGFTQAKNHKARHYVCDFKGYWTIEQELAEMGFCTNHEGDEELLGLDGEEEQLDLIQVPDRTPL